MDAKAEIDPRHRDALEKFARARASRRQVFRGAAGLAALGLAGKTRPIAARSAAPSLSPAAINAAQRALQQTGDSAQAAVDAANALDPKPASLTLPWESELQAQDPLLYSGPKWQELTGIQINVLEIPFADMYTNMVTEHIAGTGGHDVINIVPAWQADFVALGLSEPLDAYIEQYMNPADLDDYHPLYRDLMNYGGSIYGLFDDGDVIILYTRKDLFEDPANMEEFQAQYGRELAVPTTWAEYDEVQSFFTEKMAPDLYGGASQRVIGGLHGWWMEEYRNYGGRFFDPETLEPLINGEEGKRVLDRWIESNKSMPPGILEYGFIEVLSDWMAGKLAMIGGTWPPIGRWSEGTTAEQLAWVPESQVVGNVGYSIMPEGRSAHNGGFMLGVAANSPNKEAAYLFTQWANSPTISLERCMLPYALRDPFRLSHYESQAYRDQWATAGEYLDTLRAAADNALLDLIMPGSFDYSISLDQAATAAMAGADVQESLDGLVTTWNEITDRLGRDQQIAAYAEFLKLKGAYPS
jgi:multiple sugar transport system substrate-binding protein